jgi:hypothetical protein
MRRALAPALAAALLLAGCDAARGPFAEAARAEAEGRWDDAIAHYGEVCGKTPGSPLCPRADARSDRLLVRKAIEAIADGRYGAAKPWIDTAAGSKDAAARDAAAAVAASPDFVQGLAWEQAQAIADARQALPKMEGLATAAVTSSAGAVAWLEKHRPALMLEDVKAACTPKPPEGVSCVATARKLAALHPRSAENAAAKRLVEAEYRRIYPSLRAADALLLKALPLARANAKVEQCIQQSEVVGHASSVREVCEGQGGANPDLDLEVTNAWRTTMFDIADPEIVQLLERRWSLDTVPHGWPPPAPESSGGSDHRERRGEAPAPK